MAGSQQPEGGDLAPTPRWVYAAGGLVILFAVGFVVMHLTTGGFVGH